MKSRQYSGDFFGTIMELTRATMDFMFLDKRLYDLSDRYTNAHGELKERILEFFPYDFNEAFSVLINSAIKSGQIDDRFSSEFILKILEILFSNAYKLLPENSKPNDIIKTADELINFMQYGISAKKEEEE